MQAGSPITNVAGWQVVSLKQITTKIGSGATPRGGSETYLPVRHNVALIRSQNVYDRQFDESGLAFISDEQAIGLRNVAVHANDVLLNITGDGATFGRACLAPDDVRPACVNQHVSIVRVDPALADAGYVLAFLTHPEVKPYIESFNSGGSRRAITKGHIESFKLPLPPIAEQRAIASVLSALDGKIEQNRRTTQKLEQLARSIFRAWFVDFEPVKAKAAGAASFPATPQRVFDVLPTDFVDSDIGPVPKGWAVQPLVNTATFLNGLALQKYPPRGEVDDLPVIKIAQLRRGSTEGSDLANGDVPAEYVIGDGDLLFSWSGTLEAAFWFGGKGALNQHLFKVIPNEYPRWLCLLWIHQHLPWFRAIAAGKATTMGHIKRSHLTEAKVVTATPPVLQAANDVIGPIYELYAQTMLESRKLSEMRDYLLPRLLSGDLRVWGVGAST